MTTHIVQDLVNVEVEHLLGERHGPLVLLRCQGDDVTLLAHLEPAQAREIAAHLLEAAARAEYEGDFYTEATAKEMPDELVGMVMAMVRAGEMRRMTAIGGDS